MECEAGTLQQRGIIDGDDGGDELVQLLMDRHRVMVSRSLVDGGPDAGSGAIASSE